MREGSIWGRVRWTDEAARLVAARQYRYLSPVMLRTLQGVVTRILGASLVHRPDLDLLALSAEPVPGPEAPEPEELARIARGGPRGRRGR